MGCLNISRQIGHSVFKLSLSPWLIVITISSENWELYEILSYKRNIFYSQEIGNSIWKCSGNQVKRSNTAHAYRRHRHNLYSMRTTQSDSDHQTIHDLTQDSHICTYSFLTPTISQLVICCVVYILIIVLFSVKVKQRHLFSKSGLNECKCTGYKTEVELSQHLRNQQN